MCGTYMLIAIKAKALGPIWQPQCQCDLEAHLGHIITCMYITLVIHGLVPVKTLRLILSDMAFHAFIKN